MDILGPLDNAICISKLPVFIGNASVAEWSKAVDLSTLQY